MSRTTSNSFAPAAIRASLVVRRLLPPVGEEGVGGAGRGDDRGVDVGVQGALGRPVGFGDDLAERSDDRAVTGVVELAAAPDAVDADHVRLVLDRPGSQQRAPVVTPRRGPVGDDDVAVGGGGERPELVGEAQVVTDEQAAAHAFDLDA